MSPRHTGFRAHGQKGLTNPEQAALASAALFIVLNVECERFDKTVCTGQPALDGSGVMPADITEMGIISTHSAQVGERLLERAGRLGLGKAILEAGEAYVQRMPYARVEADYQTALRVIGGSLAG